jgi:hypothetical protein
MPIKRPSGGKGRDYDRMHRGGLQDGEEKKIVLCTDRRSSSMVGSADTARKSIRLAKGWRCPTAGVEPDILALVRLYKARFANNDNLKAETIDASIKDPLFQRRKELSEEYVSPEIQSLS